MITSMFPLMVIGIPITITEVIVLQMLEIKAISWPNLHDIESIGQTLVNVQIFAVILATIYWFLSTRAIGFYASVLSQLQSRFKLILIFLIVALAGLDFYYSELGILKYLVLLLLFGTIGVFLDKKEIDPIPLLFAFVVGDKVIWTATQLGYRFL